MKMVEKAILITGATSGIGRAAAEELAARGYLVIGVGRDIDRCQRAENEIKSLYPAAQIIYLQADLSSQRQINNLSDRAGEILDQRCGGRLDVLINNAAAVVNRYQVSEDGYELQFAVNHLAGFLLTMRLLDRLQRSDAGRVLTVSSNSHRGTRINWQNIMKQKHYSCLQAYKQSKLCNVLFTHELNRRLSSTNVKAFAVDPGLVDTDIGAKNMVGPEAIFWRFRRRRGLSPYQAASTIVYLSKMPAGWTTDASYFRNCAAIQPGKQSFNEEAALRLWDLSVSLCRLAAQELPARS